MSLLESRKQKHAVDDVHGSTEIASKTMKVLTSKNCSRFSVKKSTFGIEEYNHSPLPQYVPYMSECGNN